MKVKPAKVAKRIVNTAILPVNLLITAVNMAIRFLPLVAIFAKSMVELPKQIMTVVKDMRQIGLYEFTDRKGHKFNILLPDSEVDQAINDPVAHASRELVLSELRKAVAVDTRCPDFDVPEAIYLWKHPAKGFKSITRLRDIKPSERKEYFNSPVRTAIGEYIDSVARS